MFKMQALINYRYIVTYTFERQPKEQKFSGGWEVKMFLRGLKALGGESIKIYKITEKEIKEEEIE